MAKTLQPNLLRLRSYQGCDAPQQGLQPIFDESSI
jgi:hypothetical protein